MTQIQKQESVEAIKLKTPNKYHVVMLNDDSTPMDFVIKILIAIFKRTPEDAEQLMIDIHETGRAVAGTYSYEVAEQKCVETVSEARHAGYPLDVVIEESE